MRLLRWIAGFTLAILIAAFAIANRQTTDINWSPFHEPLHWPLYLIVLAAMGFGFLIGCFMVWLGDVPLRLSARRQRRTIKNLEKELETAEKRIDETPEPATPLPPPQRGFFKSISAN